MLWLYENVEDVRMAVDQDEACFGTIDSWLLYKFTGGVNGGVHVTDGEPARAALRCVRACALGPARLACSPARLVFS